MKGEMQLKLQNFFKNEKNTTCQKSIKHIKALITRKFIIKLQYNSVLSFIFQYENKFLA